MATRSPVEKRFRERVHAERTRRDRDWTQAELAKRLRAKGLRHILATTVAKIESGERAVRIDEANALAELFAVSVDALLGRSVVGGDLLYASARVIQAASENARRLGELIQLLDLELLNIRFYVSGEFGGEHPDASELIAAAEAARGAADNAQRALAALADVPIPGTEGSEE